MVYRQVIVLNKRTLFALLLSGILCALPVLAGDAPSVSAKSAVLYDPLTQAVLFSKQADVPMGMASTTKIMTALVALELYDFQQIVTIQKAWTGIEGSSMYLRTGEQLSVEHLLYGLLLASGNDAATALAGIHPDGAEGFVAEMNRKAEALGLQNTHFENPSGLDGETHHTTAYELAVLTVHAMENERFAAIVSTKTMQIGDRWLNNHNRLLGEIDACGVKTGFTKACGRCLVSAKEQNGRMLICVTLNALNDWNDHKALFDYGFSQFSWLELLGAGPCGTVNVVGCDKKAVHLYSNDSFSLWGRRDELDKFTVKIIGPRFWYGETVPGQRYGSLRVNLKDNTLFETALYFQEAAKPLPEPESLWERIKTFFRR